MHDTAYQIAGKFFELYWKPEFQLVVELGSYDVNGTVRDHQPAGSRYLGLDIEAGPSVDIVIENALRLPLADGEADCVLSSSCFEHDKFFWQTFLEQCRITKPGGFIYLNVPSNGMFHRYPADYWRFYPDAGLALAEWGTTTGLQVTLIESFVANRKVHQWNYFVAVFQRGDGEPRGNEQYLSHYFSCQNVHRLGLETIEALDPVPEDMRLLAAAQIVGEQVAVLQRQLSDAHEKTSKLDKVVDQYEGLKEAYIVLQNEHAHYSRLLAANDETLLLAKAASAQALEDLGRERLRIKELAAKENELAASLQAVNNSLIAATREHAVRERYFVEKLAATEREMASRLQAAQQSSLIFAKELSARERISAEQSLARERELGARLLVSREEATQLAVTLAGRSAQLKGAEQVIASRESRTAELEATLEAVCRTVSWRVTEPLRIVASWFGGYRLDPEIISNLSKHSPRCDPMPLPDDATNQLFSGPLNEIVGTLDLGHPASGIAPTVLNNWIIDMPLAQTSSIVTNLDELLSLHDEHFVYNAYQILLGREPDPEGGKFFLRSVRSGVSKIEILAQIRLSAEGKSRPIKMAGLEKAIKRHQSSKLPLIGFMFRQRGANGFETDGYSLRAIENRLYLLGVQVQQQHTETTWLLGQLKKQYGKSDSVSGEIEDHAGSRQFGEVQSWVQAGAIPESGKAHLIRAQDRPKRWGVMATLHTLFIAHLVAKRLRTHGWDVEIFTDEPFGFPHDMYIVICPQMFKNLPPGEKRIAYQMEQSVSSRWFTDEYLKTLENSRAVIDYALINIEFMAGKGLVYPHIHYVPVGADPDYGLGWSPREKVCDVLFYGDAKSSPRRRALLDALKRNFDVRECSEVFGSDMIESILGARLVINLHYYENALMEMPRIQECLSLGIPVVSEASQDQADYPEISGVKFFEQGDERAMIEAVRAALSALPSTEAMRECAQRGSNRFAFMFDRFLIAQGFLPAAHALDIPLPINDHSSRIAISMPETIIRRRTFQ